jgi:hypothetical protein
VNKYNYPRLFEDGSFDMKLRLKSSAIKRLVLSESPLSTIDIDALRSTIAAHIKHIQEYHIFVPQHFGVDCGMLLYIYASLPVLPTLMLLSPAPTPSSISLLNGLGPTAAIEAAELTLLRPAFPVSFSLSLASIAAFLLRPTKLSCLVNGFGTSSSSLSLQPNPVVGPIPPRRSLPSRWRTRRRVVSRSPLDKPDLVMFDAVETFEVLEAAEYVYASNV